MDETHTINSRHTQLIRIHTGSETQSTITVMFEKDCDRLHTHSNKREMITRQNVHLLFNRV